MCLPFPYIRGIHCCRHSRDILRYEYISWDEDGIPIMVSEIRALAVCSRLEKELSVTVFLLVLSIIDRKRRNYQVCVPEAHVTSRVPCNHRHGVQINMTNEFCSYHLFIGRPSDPPKNTSLHIQLCFVIAFLAK